MTIRNCIRRLGVALVAFARNFSETVAMIFP